MEINEKLFENLKKARELDLEQLYHDDEQEWLYTMRNLYCFDKTLCEHLLYEAKSNEGQVKNYFINLVLHMLKWEYQSNRQGSSWLNSIENSSQQLRILLDTGNTLYNYYLKNYNKWYIRALNKAVTQTGMNKNAFPQEFPYDVDNFWKDENIEQFLKDNSTENPWTKFKY